nr:nucleosome assembly protein 1-like 1 [Aedes albopictus]
MRNEFFKIDFLASVIQNLTTTISPYATASSSKAQPIFQLLPNLSIKFNQLQAVTMLPPSINTKIQALNKIQHELLSKEAEFHKHVHSMEMEFQKTLGALYEKRKQIVSGSYDPIKKDLLNPEEFETGPAEGQPKGIPDFWLNVFKKTPLIQCMIWEADEPALKHLVDIRAVMFDQPKQGFTLQFEFEPNDYFSNEVLTKQYLMECAPHEEELAKFNGFEIYDTVGCEIDWKEGFKLTVQSQTGQERKLSSFFNFFQPKKMLEDCEPYVRKQLLETDFEIGYFIKERLVPRAVMFYNGDISDDDEEEEEEEEDISEDGQSIPEEPKPE